jgi:hypothetical protein
MSQQEKTGLTISQAIVLGLIPSFVTGILGLIGIFISEDRQDDRQIREVQFTQTAEAMQTQVANAFDPNRPTSTPSPTLPPTITPIPIQSPDIFLPEESIFNYYSALNENEYLEAWSLLSNDFKTSKLSNDFLAYESFWNSTGPVSIIELIPESTPTPFSAEFLVRLYWDSDLRTRAYKYYLIFDPISQLWKIDKVTGVD